MVAALRPGGWLVLEDADPALQPLICPDEYGPAQQRANRLRRGFRTLLAQRGAELAFGRTLPRLLRQAGLVDVEADGFFPVTSPACAVLETATVRQGSGPVGRRWHRHRRGDRRAPRQRRGRRARPGHRTPDLRVGSQTGRRIGHRSERPLAWGLAERRCRLAMTWCPPSSEGRTVPAYWRMGPGWLPPLVALRRFAQVRRAADRTPRRLGASSFGSPADEATVRPRRPASWSGA